jgi:hypothetical protein
MNRLSFEARVSGTKEHGLRLPFPARAQKRAWWCRAGTAKPKMLETSRSQKVHRQAHYEPPDSPAFIAVNWPVKASVSTVEVFPAVASRAATLFATAATKLAQMRRDGRRRPAPALASLRRRRASQLALSPVWDEPDVWAAIGQVGSFVVAIGALIVALVSRKDSNAARLEASRSATAAEASVQEAKRANELTESERHERARAELARAQHEADLVRGPIRESTLTVQPVLR